LSNVAGLEDVKGGETKKTGGQSLRNKEEVSPLLPSKPDLERGAARSRRCALQPQRNSHVNALSRYGVV
jgi:hypothetical protein